MSLDARCIPLCVICKSKICSEYESCRRELLELCERIAARSDHPTNVRPERDRVTR